MPQVLDALKTKGIAIRWVGRAVKLRGYEITQAWRLQAKLDYAACCQWPCVLPPPRTFHASAAPKFPIASRSLRSCHCICVGLADVAHALRLYQGGITQARDGGGTRELQGREFACTAPCFQHSMCALRVLGAGGVEGVEGLHMSACQPARLCLDISTIPSAALMLPVSVGCNFPYT